MRVMPPAGAVEPFCSSAVGRAPLASVILRPPDGDIPCVALSPSGGSTIVAISSSPVKGTARVDDSTKRRVLVSSSAGCGVKMRVSLSSFAGIMRVAASRFAGD